MDVITLALAKSYINKKINEGEIVTGATPQQVAQIEQNKNDIADLQTEVDELKESGGNGSGQNPPYELPIGGEELGGVKNGGNVVINADGTMTAPAGGASYALPVANANTLGGVKVQAKTAAMTQPVGADADGNLYTLPPAQSTTNVDGVGFINHVGNLNSGVVYPSRPKQGEPINAGTAAGTCMAFRAMPGKNYVFTAPAMSGKGSWGQADVGGICTHPISTQNVPVGTLGAIQTGGLGKYFVFKTNSNMAEDTRYLIFIGVVSDSEAPNLLIFEGDSIEGYESVAAYSPLNGLSTSDDLMVQRRNLSGDILESLRNADAAVQPEEFTPPKIWYKNGDVINYNTAVTIPEHPVGYSAHADIQSLVNSAEVSTQFLTNQIDLDFQNRYAHCPEVVVIGDTAYIAAFMNTEGGDRYDVVTAKTMLYVVDIPTMTQTGEHVVAENGSVVGDLTFPLGSGACTCVVLGDIIRVNFVAKLSDDQWHQLYRDYNPTDNVWGDIGFCKILDDGVEYDFTTTNVSAHIQEIPGSIADDGLTINTNIVGQHTVINGVYYVGVGARDQWANMPILKTTDWITFEHFATPSVEGNDAHFEMAVASNGVDTLYTATRQKTSDKLVLMKVNAATGAVTASTEIVDGNRSRPYIYKSDAWLYVAHILTKVRNNSSQISVLRANNLGYERSLTLPPMVYPAFAPCTDGIFAAFMAPYRLYATKFTTFEPYSTLDAVSAFAHLLRMTQQ